MKFARTIRVVFAAKLLKKLILHALSLLSFLVLKLLPVPVPAQGRHDFTRGGIVKSNVAAVITGCEDVAIRAEAHAQYCAHRAIGIGCIMMRIFSMRARTIRVVFAAKLLQKLVLYLLKSLSFPSTQA
jgi:hypothetical protein